MSAMEALATMDRHCNATTNEECDAYMAAYERVYGIDAAPFWAHRYPESQYDGVELVQAENGK